MKKETAKVALIRNKEGVINVDETLFQQRQVFLHSQVSESMCDILISQLLLLDKINNDPIYLYVNSPGGYVSWGFALIDVMKSLKSKVITIGSGCIASMGTVIFISGKERRCYKNTTFMFHDMFSGVVDYSQKMKARVDFQEKEWEQLARHVKEHTKLTQKELEFMRTGELWLFSEEAKSKGVVDIII